MRKLIGLIGLLILAVSCADKSAYEKLVDRELAREVKADSLFLGISMGMTPKEFFAHCWELNKKGVFTDGPSNASVYYEVTDLQHPAYMLFYPDFHENRIYKMPVKYTYKAWAPWNKHLYADRLQQDVLNLYKKKYGNDFLEVREEDKAPLYIRVDGNRRIIISQYDEKTVMVLFTDLRVDKPQKDQDWLSVF